MKIIIVLVITAVFLSACSDNKEKPSKKTETEQLSHIVIPQEEITLGEAATEILDKGENRVHNIKLACEKINDTKIRKTEKFSFNETVGKRSADMGYKDAPIIFHGEKSYGTGGGVCQVSSTLYMAALNAGMEIVERHPHSEAVAYAPGKDATVVYGEKDFVFRNNYDTDVYLYLWVQDEKVYAKIVEKTNNE